LAVTQEDSQDRHLYAPAAGFRLPAAEPVLVVSDYSADRRSCALAAGISAVTQEDLQEPRLYALAVDSHESRVGAALKLAASLACRGQESQACLAGLLLRVSLPPWSDRSMRLQGRCGRPGWLVVREPSSSPQACWPAPLGAVQMASPAHKIPWNLLERGRLRPIARPADAEFVARSLEQRP
jgi:hypothetical protein